jgi:hypothetical protein
MNLYQGVNTRCYTSEHHRSNRYQHLVIVIEHLYSIVWQTQANAARWFPFTENAGQGPSSPICAVLYSAGGPEQTGNR